MEHTIAVAKTNFLKLSSLELMQSTWTNMSAAPVYTDMACHVYNHVACEVGTSNDHRKISSFLSKTRSVAESFVTGGNPVITPCIQLALEANLACRVLDTSVTLVAVSG